MSLPLFVNSVKYGALNPKREKGIKVTSVYNCVTQSLKIVKLVVTPKPKCTCSRHSKLEVMCQTVMHWDSEIYQTGWRMLGKGVLGKETTVPFERDVEIVLSWNNEKEQLNVKTQLIKCLSLNIRLSCLWSFQCLLWAFSPPLLFNNCCGGYIFIFLWRELNLASN